MANLDHPTNREEAYLHCFIDSGAAVPEPIIRKEAYLAQILNNYQLRGGSEYVTPEMFGAKGDGVTDDTEAVKTALSENNNIILIGSYLITDDLILPQYTKISGLNLNKSNLYFTGAHGLILRGRYVTLENFSIYGDGSGVCFSTDGNVSNSHMLRITNITINNFATAVYFGGTAVWDCYFESIRINNCSTGFNTASSNFGLMCTTFVNVYFNAVSASMFLHGVKATFIGCNFGVTVFPTITIDNLSNVKFLNCNFECDSHVVRTGSNLAMFNAGGLNISFENCLFKINADANTSVFNTFTNLGSLTFKDCIYTSITGNNMSDSTFFNAGSPHSAFYGSIVFDTGSNSIPRPTGYGNTYYPNWIDRSRNIPITFIGTTIDKTKLGLGQLLYSATNKCLALYDGTNVINVTDGSIII